MCGIIGFTGKLDAKTVLLEGLKALEYRGYDSAGIALQLDYPVGTITNMNFAEALALAQEAEAGRSRLAGSRLYLCKEAGQVSCLAGEMADEMFSAHCGIGHTRWATHGGVNRKNAHPHTTGLVTLIHNGIIENDRELAERHQLTDALISETDSEVACRVIDQYYRALKQPEAAIWKTVEELRGTYSFCVLFEDQPGKIFCIRSTSPLVAADTPEGSFIASDVTALLPYTRDYFVLQEQVLAVLTPEGIQLSRADGSSESPEWLHVDWDVTAAQKNGFPHFMLKEIFEQPEALLDTLKPRLRDGLPDFEADGISDDCFLRLNAIRIVACGTASYAGMVGKRIMETMLRVPISVDIASEFRYEHPILDAQTLCIVISQSGETIDTLKAMQKAKEAGAMTLAVVNMKGSSIAREADQVLYTHAGPEIAVASTKAYIVQLEAMYLLACRMAYVRGRITVQQARSFMKALQGGAAAVQKVLLLRSEIQKAAKYLKQARDAFYIGRGLDYAFSMEGALKLKEISYIHAEAYAAGELKHGTIALIEEDTPVVAIATQQFVHEKTLANVKEVKARGAYVILVTKKDMTVPEGICDLCLTIPSVADEFTVFPVAVILQLLAYETAAGKGLDVDKPRNLAKSVTVE